MPPLPGLAQAPPPSMVPVISSSPRRPDKGKAPLRHPPRRQYNNDPLSVKPPDTAPKNARIVNRVQDHAGGLVSYHLKIGDVEINDVGVDEILDYVSALELEQFEHVKFREEMELLKVLEDEQEALRKAKLARAAERARMKGVAFVEESSDSEDSAALAESDGPTDVRVGKHGRARPDFSKFFMPPVGKGRKAFQDRDADVMEDVLQRKEGLSADHGQPPKRRRRKRDPVTGELIPLSPLAGSKMEVEREVKRRRKRHPLTGELMPIGWRYDPEEEGQVYERRRQGLEEPSWTKSPFQRLSISEHHEAKRPRLDTASAKSTSVSPVPTKAEIMGKATSQSTPKGGVLKASVIDLMSSDDEPRRTATSPRSSLKHLPKQAGNSMMKGTMGSTATTSDESSPTPAKTPTSMKRPATATPSASQRTPKASQLTTSILSPSAARASSTDPLALASADESSDAEPDGDEWFIESILGHRPSDPKTHPPELGKEPVMLYHVKWDGYAEPTWEPIESFGDRSFVDAYRKKKGLPPLPGDEEVDESDAADEAENIGEKQTSARQTNVKAISDSEDEDGAYELEKIVAHHLSDPRTHPKELGKTPVMLYQVRWKGWQEMTWEPEDSFQDDPVPLMAYKNKHGLR